MSFRISRTLRAAGVAGLLALVSACAASASAGQDPPDGGSSSGLVLNFGDQQQLFQTLLLDSGALKGAPYRVNFVEFDSGPLVDAGFTAHRIDVGFLGDLPATLAAKSRLPVVATGVYQPIGADEFLLAKPGITAISQLRGKPVAYTTGTAEQAFALRALKTAGLSQQNVEQVNVSLLQLGTVLESGAADASVVSVEQKVDYQQAHPGAKVLASQDTVQPPSYDYLLATKTALASKAKLTATGNLTQRLIKAENWEKTHQSQWVTDYYVNVEHQAPAVAKLILAAGGTANFVPITPSVQAALQNVVTLLAGTKAIPASYSVGTLFSAAETSRYNAIVKETPQHG